MIGRQLRPASHVPCVPGTARRVRSSGWSTTRCVETTATPWRLGDDGAAIMGGEWPWQKVGELGENIWTYMKMWMKIYENGWKMWPGAGFSSHFQIFSMGKLWKKTGRRPEMDRYGGNLAHELWQFEWGRNEVWNHWTVAWASKLWDRLKWWLSGAGWRFDSIWMIRRETSSIFIPSYSHPQKDRKDPRNNPTKRGRLRFYLFRDYKKRRTNYRSSNPLTLNWDTWTIITFDSSPKHGSNTSTRWIV